MLLFAFFFFTTLYMVIRNFYLEYTLNKNNTSETCACLTDIRKLGNSKIFEFSFFDTNNKVHKIIWKDITALEYKTIIYNKCFVLRYRKENPSVNDFTISKPCVLDLKNSSIPACENL